MTRQKAKFALMKKLLSLVFVMLAGQALADGPVIQTSPFMRPVLQAQNSAAAQTALGFTGTTTATVITNFSQLAVQGITLANETILGSTFAGNGASITSLNPANISGGTAGINISGNAATANSATTAGSATTATTATTSSSATSSSFSSLATNLINGITNFGAFKPPVLIVTDGHSMMAGAGLSNPGQQSLWADISNSVKRLWPTCAFTNYSFSGKQTTNIFTDYITKYSNILVQASSTGRVVWIDWGGYYNDNNAWGVSGFANNTYNVTNSLTLLENIATPIKQLPNSTVIVFSEIDSPSDLKQWQQFNAGVYDMSNVDYTVSPDVSYPNVFDWNIYNQAAQPHLLAVPYVQLAGVVVKDLAGLSPQKVVTPQVLDFPLTALGNQPGSGSAAVYTPDPVTVPYLMFSAGTGNEMMNDIPVWYFQNRAYVTINVRLETTNAGSYSVNANSWARFVDGSYCEVGSSMTYVAPAGTVITNLVMQCGPQTQMTSSGKSVTNCFSVGPFINITPPGTSHAWLMGADWQFE
jgi:hypothetical protein